MAKLHSRIPEEAEDQLRSLIATYDRLKLSARSNHVGADKQVDDLRTKLITPERLWWTDLAQAEICIIDVSDDYTVRSRLPGWRRRMREVMGETRYVDYTNSALNPNSAKPEVIRADLSECIRTVYYFYGAYGIAAKSRSVVTETLLRMALLILAVLAAIALLVAADNKLKWWPLVPSGSILYALEYMLATSAAATLGSVVSVQRRLQDPSIDVDPFYRYVTTKADRVSIAFVSPLFGAIFGLVTYGLITSRLIGGGTVVSLEDVIDLPKGAVGVAMLLVFGFLAGFAEQFIPDALTRIAARTLGGIAGADSTLKSGQSGIITTGGAQLITTTVSSVVPAKGPALGGTPVTLAGSGFTGVTSVAFGTTQATSFTIVSDTQMTAIAPSGVAGTVVDVVVGGPGGSSPTTAASQYAYV